MKALSELIVRVADLVEAEGRLLKRSTVELALALAFLVIAAVLILVGAGFVLAGLWLGLRTALGAAGASAVTGFVCVFIALGVLWIAQRLSR